MKLRLLPVVPPVGVVLIVRLTFNTALKPSDVCTLTVPASVPVNGNTAATLTETGICVSTDCPLTLCWPEKIDSQLPPDVTLALYEALEAGPWMLTNCVCGVVKLLVLVTYWKFNGFGLSVRPPPVPTLNTTGTVAATAPFALKVIVALLVPLKPAPFAVKVMTRATPGCKLPEASDALTVNQFTFVPIV